MEDEWLPFEIHPETPPMGVLWEDYFPGMNPEAFFGQLDERGCTMGVRFGPQMLMSNSRTALEAGEFAKEHGHHDAYHEAVFRAFFTECKDIGSREVILEVAANIGLDAQRLDEALDKREYASKLAETTRAAHSQGISSAPTFVINNRARIVGAVPIDELRAALSREVGAS